MGSHLDAANRWKGWLRRQHHGAHSQGHPRAPEPGGGDGRAATHFGPPGSTCASHWPQPPVARGQRLLETSFLEVWGQRGKGTESRKGGCVLGLPAAAQFSAALSRPQQRWREALLQDQGQKRPGASRPGLGSSRGSVTSSGRSRSLPGGGGVGGWGWRAALAHPRGQKWDRSPLFWSREVPAPAQSPGTSWPFLQ